jgi:hypothetical protein
MTMEGTTFAVIVKEMVRRVERYFFDDLNAMRTVDERSFLL